MSAEQSSSYRPQLMKNEANMPRRNSLQLVQSETDVVTDNESIVIKELAYTIHSAMVKLRRKSISHKVLLKLIQAHLKLKSNAKATYYLNELLRLKYMKISTFLSQSNPCYSFCMQAILSF